MGKLQEFSIRLDNPRGVYTSGDLLVGAVVVHITAAMKMRGIRVTFLGRSGVNWRETKNQGNDDSNKTMIIHFNAEEVYLNRRKILWGHDSDTDYTGSLPAGYYEFPFSVPLPKNLPCSFEGDHGCINYKITATIDKPWKRDHNVKRFFSVIGMYDLNIDPQATEPIMNTADQAICCGCCNAGHFSLRYTIDRRGFVPGEEIPLQVQVKNRSSRRLLSEVKFKMVTTYFAHDDSKKQEEEMEKFAMDPVSPHSSGTLRTTIDIPPTPPSHLPGCDIIDVDYVIRLKITPEGCYFDSVEFHDEILIGTIPLRQVVARMLGGDDSLDTIAVLKEFGLSHDITAPAPLTNEAPPPYGATPMHESRGTSALLALSPALTGLAIPAPVYAKCEHSKGKMIDDDDVPGEDFTPQYTFYNWKTLVEKMREQAAAAKKQYLEPRDQNIVRGNPEAAVRRFAMRWKERTSSLIIPKREDKPDSKPTSPKLSKANPPKSPRPNITTREVRKLAEIDLTTPELPRKFKMTVADKWRVAARAALRANARLRCQAQAAGNSHSTGAKTIQHIPEVTIVSGQKNTKAASGNPGGERTMSIPSDQTIRRLPESASVSTGCSTQDSRDSRDGKPKVDVPVTLVFDSNGPDPELL